MYKNRYFKTTNGVPFELGMGLVPSQTITNQATINFKNFTAVINELYPIRIVPGSADRYLLMKATSAWNAGTSLPANPANHYISFASCSLGGASGTSTFQNMTTPLLASSIRIVKSQAATAAVAQKTSVLINGAYTAGQLVQVKIIETTPGNDRLPYWDYEFTIGTATPTGVATSLIAVLPTVSTVGTSATADSFVYAATGASATYVRLTSNSAGRSFKVSFNVIPTKAAPTESAWLQPTIVTDGSTVDSYVTAAPKWGYGTADQLTNLIQEDAARRGVGHYYPTQDATAADFGVPDSGWTAIQAAVAGATPYLVTLTGVKQEATNIPGVGSTHTNQVYIHLYCDTAMATALAVMFPA